MTLSEITLLSISGLILLTVIGYVLKWNWAVLIIEFLSDLLEALINAKWFD